MHIFNQRQYRYCDCTKIETLEAGTYQILIKTLQIIDMKFTTDLTMVMATES